MKNRRIELLWHDPLCPWQPGSMSWNCACELITRVRTDERYQMTRQREVAV